MSDTWLRTCACAWLAANMMTATGGKSPHVVGLAAWNGSDIFSDAAVLHLRSLITDPFCFVVVTLGMSREPRS
jgi:hypothetical protein